MQTKKKALLISLAAIIFCAIIVLVAVTNLTVEITRVTVEAPCLPETFEGFKIAHVSDLHNVEDHGLLDILRRENPDIIAITGDIIDSPSMENTVAFVREAQKIAPCYYVTGNHEAYVEDDVYVALESELILAGVTVLHNDAATVESGNAKIRIVGVDDPKFNPEGINSLGELCNDGEFTVLLSHRPELFEKYVAAGAELVLSGHAHGGQFRIPFVGGVYAPDQGLFPKYDAGLYTEGETNMFVSRGLGHSGFPFRLNNTPEVVFIELLKY